MRTVLLVATILLVGCASTVPREELVWNNPSTDERIIDCAEHGLKYERPFNGEIVEVVHPFWGGVIKACMQNPPSLFDPMPQGVPVACLKPVGPGQWEIHRLVFDQRSRQHEIMHYQCGPKHTLAFILGERD